MALTWNGGCGQGGGGQSYDAGPGIRINGNTISADIREGEIARSETSPSVEPHAEGEYIIVDNTFYEVTAAIAVGDTITEGVNVSVTNVGDALAAIKNGAPVFTRHAETINGTGANFVEKTVTVSNGNRRLIGVGGWNIGTFDNVVVCVYVQSDNQIRIQAYRADGGAIATTYSKNVVSVLIWS